jgi:hypothetical protein
MSTANRTYLLQSLSRLAVKNVKDEERATEKISASQEIFLTAKTVFPFTLFPDSVSVDRTNITIAHRVFFRMAVIVTVKIEDILTITPSVGPFFGSLRIVTAFVDPHSPYFVNYLRRDDALKITRIVKGYKASLEQKIDTSTLSKKELVELLDRLARDGTEV